MSERGGSQGVSLGCGTLVLIALIVLIFSGGGKMQDVETKVDNLNTEIENLRTVVEQQTQEIKLLRDEVAQANK